MTHATLAAAAAALLVAHAAGPAAQTSGTQAARASDMRSVEVYASVVDSKGMPVPGVTAADLTVREDNVAREVLKVEPATEPMQIALVVDDSQAAEGAIPYMRDALTAFVEALAGKAEIAIITVGERPTSLSEYSSSTESLKQAIGRLFARPGSGAHLTEAISDVSRGLQRRNATRPVIVALSIEAVEFSNQYYETVLKELQESGATLHVIGLGTRNPTLNDEMRNRNMLIVEGTERTGGRRDTILTPQAFPERLKQLAAELQNQYVVTYSRPDSLVPPEKLQVRSTRPGVTVRATNRAPVVKKR